MATASIFYFFRPYVRTCLQRTSQVFLIRDSISSQTNTEGYKMRRSKSRRRRRISFLRIFLGSRIYVWETYSSLNSKSMPLLPAFFTLWWVYYLFICLCVHGLWLVKIFNLSNMTKQLLLDSLLQVFTAVASIRVCIAY